MSNDYYVLSFSGGKNSTALLLLLLEKQLPLDELICCDTGMEFEAMERHIAKCKEMVESLGIKFTTLKSEHPWEYWMFEREVNRKESDGKGLGYSWPAPRQRWCTGRLKTMLVRNYTAELELKYDVKQYVGLAADELWRAERKNNAVNYKLYPLIEWGISDAECVGICYERGFNWEGLYDLFDRVSCWCCPLQGIDELRKLRKHFPDYWARLMDMDNRTWRRFKEDYTVAQLEIRFALEEELGITKPERAMRVPAFRKKYEERIAELQGGKHAAV